MNSSLKDILEKLDSNYEFPIEEENTTSNLDGGQGQPSTPYAFTDKEEEPDDAAYSEPVQETDRFYKKIEDIYHRINLRVESLSEARYSDYVSDDTQTQTQKINNHVLEINKKLREVEQMITHASRLKSESGSNQGVFWKKTVGSFIKIKERLNRLSSKIVEMGS
tara:strand:+ start:297 stop:791 length:495 start_codon:yes stop_codon:yes gene_type:complete